jgi:hypothetical protein
MCVKEGSVALRNSILNDACNFYRDDVMALTVMWLLFFFTFVCVFPPWTLKRGARV